MTQTNDERQNDERTTLQSTSDVVFDHCTDASMYIHSLCEDLMCCSKALMEIATESLSVESIAQMRHCIGSVSDVLAEIVSDHENDCIHHLDAILNQITEKTDDLLSS